MKAGLGKVVVAVGYPSYGISELGVSFSPLLAAHERLRIVLARCHRSVRDIAKPIVEIGHNLLPFHQGRLIALGMFGEVIRDS